MGHGGSSPAPRFYPGKGRAGQLKHMKKIPPSNGKGAPNLFYCRPTDNKGGPCQAPDCDGRSPCLLQLQHKQKNKDGQEVKHQDNFSCTELINKVLYIMRRRPLVQELVSRKAEMEAHIDDRSLGTNTQEDHILFLQELFTVCQESHLRIKLEKCEFMREQLEYRGFDFGYGWWKPAASKMQPVQDVQIRDDTQKGLHDVRSFTGACNFYQRHRHNLAYASAPLTDLIKKNQPLAVDRQGGGLFPGVEEENLLYQLPGGTPP